MTSFTSISVIAEADTREEIEEHWKWLEEHLMPTLGGIDAGVDITDYVQCKIKSLCAQVDEDEIDGKNNGNIGIHSRIFS